MAREEAAVFQKHLTLAVQVYPHCLHGEARHKVLSDDALLGFP
jgi:hypothetical protein